MAMGFGEYTGRPGISVATIGPGAANAVGGVAAAFLERAPVVALTATRAPGSAPGSTHQLLDLGRLFGPVSKGSFELSSENAEESVAAAIALARQPRPGPVHIAVASEVAGAAAASPWERAAPGVASEGPGAAAAASSGEPDRAGARSESGLDARSLARARSQLASAHRPAVIVGLGVRDPSRAPVALDLARAIGGPVASTPKAKGIVPEDDPLFCGTLEGAGESRVVRFLSGADLLVCLGVDSVEFARPWRFDAPVIHIDDFPADGYYQPSAELSGDVTRAMAGLREAAGGARDWGAADVATVRAEVRDSLRSSAAGLQPVQVVDAVRAALPRDAIATVDVGAHKVLLDQAWPVYEQGTFFVANGLSSMGYAVPVAAAIRLAEPARPIVAFVGDGGLTMYLGELETIVRLGLDLLVVVFADASLELIRLSQVEAGVPEVGTTFADPDWAALGRAFGIAVHEVDSPVGLTDAVTRAVAAKGVRLLVAHVDRGAYRLG